MVENFSEALVEPSTAAYVQIVENEVVGVFNSPQNDPAPEGYEVIDSDDERIAAFFEKISNLT